MNYSISLNISEVNTTTGTACIPCPSCDESDSGSFIALAVIIGIIVGSVGTLLFMMLLRRFRPIAPPPKDYDQRSDQQTFDVNRNNDRGLLTTGNEETDVESNKPHKKLQRLVQRNHYQDTVTFPSSTTAVPLLHDTDTTGVETNNSKQQTDKQNILRASETPTKQSLTSIGEVEDEENGVDYVNLGQAGLLEQPYDSLAVVPEEADEQNVYEPIKEENNLL